MNPADQGPADEVLAEASVILVAGPGGVGKTTVAAALAVAAARRHGRRVLLTTVDPARRLADALGLGGLPSEPVLVPVGSGAGRLFALMVDMADGWDALVERVAQPGDRDALVANPLYRTLTTRFVQSHDYIALDHLCSLDEDDRWDLVIVDTPPSGHAIDILDAPEKLVEFFDSRLLRWLTAPYRSRLAAAGARPFLALAERLLGGAFLARIGEFFWLFSRMQPGIVARARQIRARLDDPDTGYVLVTTSEAGPLAQTADLHQALEDRGHQPALLVHNRAAPLPPDTSAEAVLAAVADEELRSAMAVLVADDERVGPWWAALGGTGALHVVPTRPVAPSSVEDLDALFDRPGTRPAGTPPLPEAGS